MSTDTWLQPLKTIARPLLASGNFRITSERSDPKAFGNALIILDSSRLRLRFIVDRAESFAAVASPSRPEEWYDLKSVLKALGYFSDPLGPWKHPDGKFRPNQLPDEPVVLALRHQALLEVVASNSFKIVGGHVRRVQ